LIRVHQQRPMCSKKSHKDSFCSSHRHPTPRRIRMQSEVRLICARGGPTSLCRDGAHHRCPKLCHPERSEGPAVCRADRCTGRK
jgi:hypothetical protein